MSVEGIRQESSQKLSTPNNPHNPDFIIVRMLEERGLQFSIADDRSVTKSGSPLFREISSDNPVAIKAFSRIRNLPIITDALRPASNGDTPFFTRCEYLHPKIQAQIRARSLKNSAEKDRKIARQYNGKGGADWYENQAREAEKESKRILDEVGASELTEDDIRTLLKPQVDWVLSGIHFL